MADRYLQEDGVSFYQLEGGGVTDVYIMEAVATSGAAGMLFVSNLTGLGSGGPFFQARLP